ncbi:hypothetical protein INR49_001400 [Caranx melampygus]|nr:hypothetical protein INR49_001400 [Caranx melampygus]
MKLILLLAISCLALHNAKGAPSTAMYKFVRCNPVGDQANCVTHQGPEMAWNPDLPAKLPASAAQYLEAEPVEDESPQIEEEEEEMEEENDPMIEERLSPELFPAEEGSGGYEGSGFGFMEDQAIGAAESETGSGEKDMDQKTGEDLRGLRRLFPSRSAVGEAKPAEQELRDDHLLQL